MDQLKKEENKCQKKLPNKPGQAGARVACIGMNTEGDRSRGLKYKVEYGRVFLYGTISQVLVLYSDKDSELIRLGSLEKAKA